MSVELHRDLPSAPRAVKLKGQYQLARILLLVLGLGLPAGAGFTLFGKVDTLSQIVDDGAVTMGTVTKKNMRRSKSKKYFVHYDYEVDGQPFSGKSRLKRARWERIEVDQSVPIAYAKADPSIQRLGPISKQDVTRQKRKAWILTAVLAVAFGLAFFFCQRFWGKHVRLLREGRPIDGAVVSYEHRKNKQHPDVISYRYRAPAGGDQERTEKLACKPDPQPEPGDPITVLRHPDRPDDVATLPRVLAYATLAKSRV